MHGYELLQEYARQEVEDWAMISRPHVYYALKKLHQAKLIASARREARADARAVPFRVTPAGRRSLARALDDPAWATRPSVPPFTTWMGLSIHTSAAARKRVIAARTHALGAELLKERATLAAIRADAGERVGVAEWMLGLRVAQVELELTWLASPPP